MNDIQHITPEEAWKLTKQGTLLVDVREANEVAQKCYKVNHYLHLPLSTLTENFAQIPIDKTVIIACHSGGRSQKAIAFLLEQGYKKLLNLDGGILSWEKAELPII